MACRQLQVGASGIQPFPMSTSQSATWRGLHVSCLPAGSSRRHQLVRSRPVLRVTSAVGENGSSSGSAAKVPPKLKSAPSRLKSTSSTAPPDAPVIVTQSYPGTPLMWIGVGVAITVFVNWASKSVYQRLQQAMMRQVFEAMKSGGGGGGSAGMPPPFPFPGGMPPGMAPPAGMPGMPFPPPPFGPPPPAPSQPSSSPAAAAAASPFSPAAPTAAAPSAGRPKAKSSAFVDVQADVTDVKVSTKAAEAAPSPSPSPSTTASSGGGATASDATTGSSGSSRGANGQAKRSAFQDVEVVEEDTSGGYSWSSASTSSSSSSSFSGYPGMGADGRMTVDLLEKMLEDPTVQRMVFPYLPEEMRDPATFKWMMQNPQYRQQLQQMLDSMGGGAFDPRVVDMMKNFDLNSPDVKDQFSQLGMSPEDVVSKIMGNPKLAAAFQNPRLQAAILDVSSNPMNWTKYQNDPEVMELFTQIQEMFAVRP